MVSIPVYCSLIYVIIIVTVLNIQTIIKGKTMRLYIKQRVLSLRAKFDITDEFGEVRYLVEGEVFTIGRKLHIYDSSGEEVAFVRQKVMSIMPRFHVFVNGEQIVEILKEFTFLKPRYHIIGKGWVVEGDLLQHDYSIMSDGEEIAKVHKVWMSWGDSFELDITDSHDEVGLIAVILAIDAVMDSNNSSGSYS